MQRFKPTDTALALLVLMVMLIGCTGCPALRPPSGVIPEELELDKVKIPINFVGARNVGSLQLELVYNPAVLEPIWVKKGTQAPDAVLEYEVRDVGRLTIGIIATAGINGGGAMAQVLFKVLDKEGFSPLDLERMEALDAVTLVDIPTEGLSGGFDAGSFWCPKVRFST